MDSLGKHLGWGLLALLGASSLGYIALNRGEQINALWIVVAAVCVYLIAYRYYGLFIAKRVLAVDSSLCVLTVWLAFGLFRPEYLKAPIAEWFLRQTDEPLIIGRLEYNPFYPNIVLAEQIKWGERFSAGAHGHGREQRHRILQRPRNSLR